MRGVVDQVLRVGGEMVMASGRGRAGRAQMIDWAARLRSAANSLEEAARGH